MTCRFVNSKFPGQVRDEMLMGFTVLQKTDGSFSFGPAFVKDLNMKEPDVEAGATELGKTKGLQYRALYEH